MLIAGHRGERVLIAGTDTGVGKTLVSALLLAALRRRGVRALAMKPVESGCPHPDRPRDALTLAALAAEPVALDDLCPYRLALPVAPQSAARAEGARIEVRIVAEALQRLQRRAELVLVESAGGLGSPLGPRLLVLDLARQLELPVLLVTRHVLGTVGQTLLALRALQAEGVTCTGVVLNQTSPDPPGPEAATHVPLIEEHGGVPVLAVLPHVPLPLPSPDARDELARWSERCLELVDLTRIMNRLSA